MRSYRLAALCSGLAIGLWAATAGAQTHVFTVDPDFDSGILNNVVHNPSNQLQLGPTQVSKTNLVWVDNYNYGWIVRIDATTGKQTARFDSALQFINGQATGARPSKEWCDWASTGNCPGRVAVDTNGDVWIVNRAFGRQGTLSKFSGNIGHCIDRNNNGVIDTSKDVDNNGVIDANNPQEYLGQNDECILTTIPVGGIGDCPRSVAVDKKGKIWVGTCCGGYKIYRFNPNEPVALEATLQMPAGACMYSAASGGDYVFFSNRGPNSTIRVNIDTLQVQNVNCGYETYGVVGDPGGGWAWLGGYGESYIRKADFTNNTCTSIPTVGQVTAMTLDLQGNVWAAGYSAGTVMKFSPAGVLMGTYAAGGSNPHGLSVDFAGNIWSVQDGYPNLVKFAPDGTNLGAFNIGAPGYDATPYLYSDFTGVQINRIAPYTRVGIWEGTYDGQVNGIPWSTVSWNGEPQGIVPAETSLAVSVRASDSQSSLITLPYSPCQNFSPMVDIKGRFVQVKIDFNGPGYKTPVLSDLSVQGPCATLGELCCVMDPDCNDNNKCTLDQCPVPGGSCVHSPIQDCCDIDPDCNDSNACTVDSCDAAGHCQHIQQLGCCMSNADCHEQPVDDVCTADLCSGLGGTCSNLPINGCCMTDLDCTKGNLCSASTCPVPGGLCNIQYKPGCCQGDPDCADNDLCTQDLCNMATNTCSNTTISDCCNLDKDCPSSGGCDIATCSGPGGICLHEAKKDCCTPTSPEVGLDCEIPVSPYDHLPCKPGKFVCNNDKLECVGAVHPVSPEKCNWKDENCDGNIDENSCAEGEACINGICAKKCGSPEFPCPDHPGWQCKSGVCLPGTCTVEVVCPADYTCVNGDCIKGDGGTAGGAGAAGAAGAAGNAGGAGAAGASGAPGDGGVVDASNDTGAAGHAQAGSAGSAGAGGGGTPKPASSNQNFGMTTGGGGCSCATEPSSRSGWQLWAAAALACAAVARRRRQ
jgi:MYXO-CTERM domain-containing protein